MTGSRVWQRLVFLLPGSAVSVAFVAIGAGLVAALAADTGLPVWVLVLVGAVIGLLSPVLVGLLGVVREVEAVAASGLLGVRFPDGPPGPAREWNQRWRSALWFVLHLLAGLVVAVALVIGVPLALMVAVAPLTLAEGSPILDQVGPRVTGTPSDLWMPVAGILGLVAVVALWTGLAAGMTKLAPALLGPSPHERYRHALTRADQLAERTRLARELHDGLGHALSLVVVQAGAARRVHDSDPAFAAGALEAIETAARTALVDLDEVLGLLRDDGTGPADRAPTRDLRQIATLVDASTEAGLDVRLDVRGDLDEVPGVVSREAYRIVQEALTNALRHSANGPLDLAIDATGEGLRVTAVNPVAGSPKPRSGGRGLSGVRERVATLNGSVQAGPHDGTWRLLVELPHPGQVAP